MATEEQTGVKTEILRKGMHVHDLATESAYDMFVANSLVDMYSKCGSLSDAAQVFESMHTRSVVSWTALISGYTMNGHGHKALRLFALMVSEGCPPNAQTFVAGLKACASTVSLEAGRNLHKDISTLGFDRMLPVVNTLIDFYSKCGSVAEGRKVFDSTTKRDSVTYTTLLAGYSRQGNTVQVFELLQRMVDEKLTPDGVTFLSVLSACTHAGLVEEGEEVFELMVSRFRLVPDIQHYHCMIDLLGRANRLDEAVEMVKRMPYEATTVTWITVLSACHKWGNVQVGRVAFESLLKLEQADQGFVLMGNIYASAGMWKEREEI